MLSPIYPFNPWLVAVGLNTIFLLIGWIAPAKLLTPSGLLHAWLLGILIWGSLGWQGYILALFYFLVGSAATRIGMAQKEAEGIAEKRSGARGPENVWGSALTGAICALGTLVIPALKVEPQLITSLLLLGYVASFSTKLADTCGSEVGKVYGKQTILITTLQPVPRGTDGAVSLEGTLAGLVASMVIALLGWAVGFVSLSGVICCVLAAFIATNLESAIGATLQAKVSWLTNEVVNFINTVVGATTAVILVLAWQWYGCS
ncbi:MAG: TIGR00297 family protein [Chroococcidiopsidaceae cyanobacterium CP_BM_ER_R8_30]|nr:TIGR00297 family protein [Chroococcidiopsidaceae cyanobacterium CP_BM_ER_R8_30]